MSNDIVYHNNLLEITNDKIAFKDYYFSSMKPKVLFISNIEKVDVKEAFMQTGKYRFHGTGDLRTWYPMDAPRNKRDKIFFITIKNKWIRIEFTGENSKVIEKFQRSKSSFLTAMQPLRLY